MIKQLAKHGAADQTAEKIASEIGAAGNPAVCPGRLPDKGGGASLRKEGADPDQYHAGEHIRKVRGEHQWQAQRSDRETTPKGRTHAKQCYGLASK